MKTWIIKLLCISFIGTLVSCNDAEEIIEEESAEVAPVYLSTYLNDTESLTLEAVNSTQYKFFTALNATAHEGDNVVCSPLSLHMVLSMLSYGVESDVAEEIASVMGNVDINTLHSANTKALKYLPKLNKNAKLYISNSFWYDVLLTPCPQFIEGLATYDTEIFAKDFLSDVVGEINQWCATSTENRITDYLTESPVDYILLNALYFKSPWKYKFQKSDTQETDFYGVEVVSKVPMMHQSLRADVYRGSDIDPTAVKLLCGNGEFSVTFILPPTNQDINTFIAQSDVLSVCDNLTPEYIYCLLPRFQVCSPTMDVNDALKIVGAEKLYESGVSKIIENKAYEVNAMQKTYIDINEDGAEAAGVSSIGLDIAYPGHPIAFDRPFIFLIREESTGMILFAGKIVKL